MNLANSNARAKVMVKQWYPELFKEKEEASNNSVFQILREQVSTEQQNIPIQSIRLDANGDEMVVGEWYTDNEMHTMIYSGSLNWARGFYDGNWGESWIFPHLSSAVPARQVLIQSMLRKECEIRGYTSNNFIPIAGSYGNEYPISDWHYSASDDSLYTAIAGAGGNCVYRRGIWAEMNSQIEFYG